MKKTVLLLLPALMAALINLSGTALAAGEKEFVPMKSPTTESIRGVWGFSANDVYAVGEGGIILHYDGSNWTEMTSNTTATLQAIWGTSNTDLYAVGYSISEEVGPNKHTRSNPAL